MNEHLTATQTSTDVHEGSLTSRDGTSIAYTRLGSGPALVMVHCVGVSRATTPQPTLPAALAEHFTVYTYDRRGKGRSGNTAPYAVEREFEDLQAVIEEAGGSAVVYGFSSGATLSLLAAQAGLPIDRLVLLEPPLFPDADPDLHLATEAQRRVDEDRAAAHRWFDTQIVGVPEEVLAEMPPLSEEDIANTPSIVHELTFLPATPATRFADVSRPTLLLASDKTAPIIHTFAEQLEQALPDVTYRILPGEWHGLDDATITEAAAHFSGAPAQTR
ncbi:alpha/beta fold hydrolase [Mobilicoccus caccae]|uniref:Alpha/beta hydrolase n=1 Tax=Mobilicoccus caccae TaxID=1859295 RepID=A0ABQ6ISW7_9MICO|nr:alpha/beta hydrolase [Mobilicoccus caccae]GMA40247.1 alpha/beta hydrolase [Mobilicoccus caccae]